MAVINREVGYLFLAEPYCASRATEDALLRQKGSLRVDQWIHASFMKLVEIGEILPHEPLLSLSVVRHPADWAVTSYHHMSSWHEQGFRAYIEYQLDNHVWDETVFRHATSVDLNLKYENLQGHLNDVLDSLGSEPVNLSRVGVTKEKKDWRSYWDADLLSRFQSQLADFNRYGYK